MKLAKLVVALSATFALSSAAFADITIGVSLSATGPAAAAAMKIKKYEAVTTWPNRTYTMTYLSSDPNVSTNALVFIRGAR